MSSSLHSLSKEDAENHASFAEVEVCTETSEQRAAYRQQIKRTQAQSADKGKGKARPHGDKRKGETRETQRVQSEIKRLRGELSVAPSSDNDNYVSAGSSREAAVLRHRPSVVGASAATVARAPSLNAQRLQIVKDSIQRAQNSLAQSARMLNASAIMFQERSTACTAAAAQLSEENEVLSAAKELLGELASEWR